MRTSLHLNYESHIWYKAGSQESKQDTVFLLSILVWEPNPFFADLLYVRKIFLNLKEATLHLQ